VRSDLALRRVVSWADDTKTPSHRGKIAVGFLKRKGRAAPTERAKSPQLPSPCPYRDLTRSFALGFPAKPLARRIAVAAATSGTGTNATCLRIVRTSALRGKCGRDVLVMTFQVMTPKRVLRPTSATSGVRSAESPQSIPEFFSISNAIDNDFLLRPSLILRQHAQSSGEGGSMPAYPMTISRCSDAAAAPTTK
jgi:hypothetical protein